MLENLLNEVFDNEDTSLYPVQDLTPKAKVPQMLHIKVPGTNDLLVRLTHMDTVGTRVKAVVPGDKSVQVFLMSLSDKGNITDFRNGLGSDPVGAINTIFSAVFDIAKKFRFESVLFRFPKNKMKGQEKAVQRIMERLIKNRSGGRFNSLEEIQYQDSKKFSYVMAYKKGSDILNEIPLDDNIEKVETKVGDAFVDKDTGKQLSKAEAVAAAVVKKSEKISTKSVIAKTKITKHALIAALYGDTEQTKLSPKALEVFYDLQSTAEPLSAKEALPSKALYVIEDRFKNSRTSLAYQYEVAATNKQQDRFKNNLVSNIVTGFENKLIDDMGFDITRAEKLSAYIFGRASDIIKKSKPFQINNTFRDIATAALENEDFRSLSLPERVVALTPLFNHIGDDIQDDLTKAVTSSAFLYGTRDWSEKQTHVIADYCNTSYGVFNGFLRGLTNPGTPERMYEVIETMDSVFAEHGVKLKRGTLLYRGQKLVERDFITAMENKMFYFRNYVSTSLLPLIYRDTQFGSSTIAPLVATDQIDNSTASTMDIINSVKGFNDKHEDMRNNLEYGTTDVPNISYIISGADKVKVVIPGPVAEYYDEHEVILPRGTVIKYNKVSGGAAGITQSKLLNTVLVEAEVMDPSMLKESVVYDGDLFMESGEFVAVNLKEEETAEVTSPLSFSAQYAKPRFEGEVDDIMSRLATYAFGGLPEKFKS